jgi:ABC-2 type transport system permease protein
MKNTLKIMVNFFRLVLTDKKNLLVFFLLPPLVFTLVIVIWGQLNPYSLRLGVINLDEGYLGQVLIDYLNESYGGEIILIGEDEISEMLLNSKVDACLEINSDFTASFEADRESPVLLYSLKGKEVSLWVENDINQYLNNIRILKLGFMPDQSLASLIQDLQLEPAFRFIIHRLEDTSSRKRLNMQGFSLLLLFIMIQALNTTRLTLKDKQRRTYLRIRTAPVSETSYTLGNLMACFIIIFWQVCITLLFIKYGLRLPLYASIFNLLTVLLLFGMCATAIGFVVNSFSTSLLQAEIVALMVINLTCMLGGCFWPINFMPVALQRIADFLPQKWTIDALSELQENNNLSQLGVHLSVLIGIAIILCLISIYKARRTRRIQNFT